MTTLVIRYPPRIHMWFEIGTFTYSEIINAFIAANAGFGDSVIR